MYFPYFKVRRFEKEAINATIFLYNDHKIIPILDPLNEEEDEQIVNSTLKSLITTGILHKKQFIVVIEDINQFTEIKDLVKSLNDSDWYSGCIIGLYDSDFEKLTIPTTGNIKVAILHSSVDFKISSSDNIQYHIFLRQTQFDDFIQTYPQKKRVKLEDAFIALSSNREYPEEDTFSDLYSKYSKDYCGFGDYLTLGSTFKVASGANMKYITVALHLTYIKTGEKIIRVRHYLTTPDEESGFTKRVLSTLKKAQNNFHIFNMRTSGMDMIDRQLTLQTGTSLGRVKQISLQHHIDLIHGLL